MLYTAVAAATGAWFVYLAAKLFRTREDKAMRKAGRALFTYSLSYLALIFVAFLADHAVTTLGLLP
jgi:protoheme IX farnesyltransferase